MSEAVRAAIAAGDLDGALTAVFADHEREVFGYLVARAPSRADAEDAFAQWAEDVWNGLESFRWQCTLRTWVYVLARSALSRTLRSPHLRAERRERLSRVSRISALADRIRSETAPWKRTEVKDAIRDLRAQLTDEERELLALRIDRKMAWDEIARVVGGWADDVDSSTIKRTSARLRQRYRRAKSKLRDLARDAGLVT